MLDEGVLALLSGPLRFWADTAYGKGRLAATPAPSFERRHITCAEILGRLGLDEHNERPIP